MSDPSDSDVAVTSGGSKKRPRRLEDMIRPECILTALFLMGAFFFLCLGIISSLPEDPTAAQVSVDRLLVNIQQHIPKRLRRMTSTKRRYKEEPMETDEVIAALDKFIAKLHKKMKKLPKPAYEQEIWKTYFQLAQTYLYPWDREYLARMPKRRDDDSIFLSIASYRDENCMATLTNAYQKAKRPNLLNVGLVQQNCHKHCISGVLKDGTTQKTKPDPDCHRLFCDSEIGKPHCEAGRVRALHVEEVEALGPYAARYFASKLWSGESWFLQIDAHMTFAMHWDDSSLRMLHKAPSEKPILSHYPPDAIDEDIELQKNKAAPRICIPNFSADFIEGSIIRLDGNGAAQEFDGVYHEIPRFAPFVAAGYYVAHSGILKDAPYDPFLPYVFMGEEIIMSSRYWTHGYDIFAPSYSVVGHIYERKFKPKFWETIDRFFGVDGINDDLGWIPLERIKHQLQYIESSRDFIHTKSVLFGLEHYTMGTERSIWDYLELAGIDPIHKVIKKDNVAWCVLGVPPPFLGGNFTDLYPKGDMNQLEILKRNIIDDDQEEREEENEETEDGDGVEEFEDLGEETEGEGGESEAIEGEGQEEVEEFEGETNEEGEDVGEVELEEGAEGEGEEDKEGEEEEGEEDDDDVWEEEFGEDAEENNQAYDDDDEEEQPQ